MKRKELGFTLIELMVVIAIIGVLVQVAVPNYIRHRRKAIQSEAKIALSSIFTLEKSFYTEYTAYIPSFSAIGYSVEGRRREYYHVICTGGVWGGTISGYSGTSATTEIVAVGNTNALTNNWNGSCTGLLSCPAYGSNPQVFVAYAQGNLGVSYDDMWKIDENKRLSNCSLGI